MSLLGKYKKNKQKMNRINVHVHFNLQILYKTHQTEDHHAHIRTLFIVISLPNCTSLD